MRTVFILSLTLSLTLSPAIVPAWLAAQDTPVARVSKEQLARLRWLSGHWVGRGTDGTEQAPFYERYRFFNDSLLIVDSFTDSTFTKVAETARYVLSGTRFGKEGNGPRWVASRIDSISILFAPVTGARNGFKWERTGPMAAWTATIIPTRGPSRYYQMLPARVPADSAGVRAAAFDYIDGFYEGDSTRHLRSIRPEVYKYGFYIPRDSSRYTGEQMTWPQFFEYTRNVRARNRPPNPSWPREVELLDVLDQTAAVKIRAWWGIDYLLMGRFEGRWMITHVLWQTPSPIERP